MVRDEDDKYSGWDVPGGKLLWGELIKEAAFREVLEETGYKVRLENLLGVYQRKTGPDDEDYLRYIFIGKLASNYQRKYQDPKILEIKWILLNDILKNRARLRSKEVAREVLDFKKGIKYPLELVKEYIW